MVMLFVEPKSTPCLSNPNPRRYLALLLLLVLLIRCRFFDAVVVLVLLSFSTFPARCFAAVMLVEVNTGGKPLPALLSEELCCPEKRKVPNDGFTCGLPGRSARRASLI